MRVRATILRGAFIAPLFFLLGSSLYGQIQIVSPLYREKIVKAGERFTEDISILNRGKDSIEILMFLKDYKIDKGKSLFLKPDSTAYSNASWIAIEYPRFLLKKERQVSLKIPISVPLDTKPGSYHSLLIIRPQIHRPKRESGVGMQIYYQTAIQIVHTVIGGKKEVKIIKTEVNQEEEKLIVEIQNIGDIVFEVLFLRIELEGIKQGKCRIYPGQIGQVILDISNLADKLYKDVRVILDDGKRFLKAEFITFRKGEEPKILPLVALKGEKIKGKGKRKGRPYSLYANLNYGSRRRGLSLSGNLRQGNFSFMASSNYNEYIFGDIIQDSESYQISANYRKKWFNIGFGSYIYSGQWVSMFRTGVRFRSTRLNLNYGLSYKIISLNINQRIFKKYFLRLYTFKSPYRTDWNLSLSIPIL